MRRRPTYFVSFFFLLVFAAFSLHLSRTAISRWQQDFDLENHQDLKNNNHVIIKQFSHQQPQRRVSSINYKDSISTVSILLPDWEILVIFPPNAYLPHHPDGAGDDQFQCLFHNNAISTAKFSGILPFTNRTTFKCDMPESVRHDRMFSQPMMVERGYSVNESPNMSPTMDLLRWNLLVYESFSTEDDVVVFAKGVNHRQGFDKSPNDLRCVFVSGNDVRNAVRTALTSSVQEVFRCRHPNPAELDFNPEDYQVEVSIEILETKVVVPSVAYYMPRPRPNKPTVKPKHLLCACTMVYNVAKFLREWVMYHSKVGVDNFILYDNASDDDLEYVINELRAEGYNISTFFWIWPKTQEGGFSHSVLYSKSKEMCTWIMYVDVDEFVFSPSWLPPNSNDSNGPVPHDPRGPVRHGPVHFDQHHHGHNNTHDFPSLKSMLPHETLQEGESRIGQVSIRCHEFGPSGQRQHPKEGVTQGYTCRMGLVQRHKSILLVDAVDPSLWNVIHHFKVNEREGYVSNELSLEMALVNHYKYQAWDEFKNKFRRRVSAYVVDWRQTLNPNSRDRTPGLGFEPIEPEDWTTRFCEITDKTLKSLTRAWFGSSSHHGYKMAWQTG